MARRRRAERFYACGALERFRAARSTRTLDNFTTRMLSFIAFTQMAALSGSPEACLALEPAISELLGIVEERTFPGPPNYGESPTDPQETQLILVLVAPICVDASNGAAPEKSLAHITEVTLVPSSDSPEPIPREKRVKVIGTLYEAFSGHHHTPVLMSVQSVAEVV